MPQSDGVNNLHRIALRFPKEGGGYDMYRFKVNPENYTIDSPQRTTAIKTKSDIIIEDYGKDIEVINFSGTTGFRPVREEDGLKTGKQKMEQLQSRVSEYAMQGGSGNVSGSYLQFFNFTDDSYYKVHLAPQGLKVTRSKDEPLLFRYEITLVVIGSLTEADRSAVTTEEFGNVNPNASQRVSEGIEGLDGNARKTRDRNNQEISRRENTIPNSIGDNTNEGNRLKQNFPSSSIYNPRQSTNGLKGNIDNMALVIGYGDGGVSS